MDFTDVETCGDHVFMAAINKSDPQDGVLRVYKGFNMERSNQLELVMESEGKRFVT